MLVEDLMTTDVVTCEYEADLQTAVVRLLEKRVGSVIVMLDGDPTGIVTETDALRAGAAANRPFSEIPVDKVYSSPLVTVPEGVTIRKAVNRMKENQIKKLPVVDGIELKGIVTTSDVALHHDDALKEAHEIEERREKWKAINDILDEL